jgi:23S rRNA (pseudouridine1915-N3)-methyltransferase
MQRVILLCVGKLKEKFYAEAAAEYAKRLSRYCKLEIVELAEERLPETPSAAQIEGALSKEAENIRRKLPPSSRLIALCVEGRLYSSEELARTMAAWAAGTEMGQEKRLVFLIGGSFGLHASIKAEAWAKLSMSPMTFPHHLARVMLLEQIYRAYQINGGTRYHK